MTLKVKKKKEVSANGKTHINEFQYDCLALNGSKMVQFTVHSFDCLEEMC